MSIELSPQSELFYNGRLQLDYLQARRGYVIDTTVEIPSWVSLINDPESYSDAMGQIANNVGKLYDSVQVVKTKLGDREIATEIGVLEGSGNDVEVHDATYSSSLVANKGNGFDVARSAFLRPDATHVYVGAPGIGESSGYTPAERKYLRRWGRLLVDDPVSGKASALPIVEARAKALHHLGVKPTDLHSDSAGALLSLAYGAVYGAGNIQTSHQNVRPGVKDIDPLALAYGMLHVDSTISKQHAAISPDLFKMGEDKTALVEQSISDRYKEQGFKNGRDVPTLLANLVGLGRGPSHGDPLVADNTAFVRANPEAKILFTLGSEDPLTRSPDVLRRLAWVCARISSESNTSVNGVVFEGMSHNIQTHYPQLLTAVSKFILG